MSRVRKRRTNDQMNEVRNHELLRAWNLQKTAKVSMSDWAVFKAGFNSGWRARGLALRVDSPPKD